MNFLPKVRNKRRKKLNLFIDWFLLFVLGVGVLVSTASPYVQIVMGLAWIYLAIRLIGRSRG